MAELNLITGSFTGVVGQLQGQKWKYKHIVKSRCFSKAPATGKQKDALEKFVILNRICSKVVKAAGNAFPLSTKKMYKHNALAQRWKACVEGKFFDLNPCFDTFADFGYWSLKYAIYMTQDAILDISWDSSTGSEPTRFDKCFLLMYDENGKPLFEYYDKALPVAAVGVTNGYPFDVAYLFCFFVHTTEDGIFACNPSVVLVEKSDK